MALRGGSAAIKLSIVRLIDILKIAPNKHPS